MMHVFKNRSVTTIILLFALTLLLGSITGQAASNLLQNPSFEEHDESGAPVGWEGFSSSKFGNGIVLEKGLARTGQWALSFTTPATPAPLGMRSTPVPAVPGETYVASVYAMTEDAKSRVSLYIDFWGADKKRIESKYLLTSQDNVWEKLEIIMQAPPEAAWVSIIIYRTGSAGSVQRFDDAWLALQSQ